MQTYTLEVRDRNLSLASDDETMVRTTTNADALEILFYDAEWLDGFDVSVALARGDEVVEIPVTLEEPPAPEVIEEEEATEEVTENDDESDEETDDEYADEESDDDEYDEDEEQDDSWAARCVVDVPNEILTATGGLGVTVHGVIGDTAHIITALSTPLEIMQEGRA